MKRLQLREDVQAEVRALLLLTLTLNFGEKIGPRVPVSRCDLCTSRADSLHAETRQVPVCMRPIATRGEAVGFSRMDQPHCSLILGRKMDACICVLNGRSAFADKRKQVHCHFDPSRKRARGCRGNLQNFSGFFTRTPCRKFGMHRHAGPFCDPVGAKRIASVRGKQRTLCGLTSSPPTLRMN